MLLVKKKNASKDEQIRRFIALQRETEKKLEQFVEFFEFACYKFSTRIQLAETITHMAV